MLDSSNVFHMTGSNRTRLRESRSLGGRRGRFIEISRPKIVFHRITFPLSIYKTE